MKPYGEYSYIQWVQGADIPIGVGVRFAGMCCGHTHAHDEAIQYERHFAEDRHLFIFRGEPIQYSMSKYCSVR